MQEGVRAARGGGKEEETQPASFLQASPPLLDVTIGADKSAVKSWFDVFIPQLARPRGDITVSLHVPGRNLSSNALLQKYIKVRAALNFSHSRDSVTWDCPMAFKSGS